MNVVVHRIRQVRRGPGHRRGRALRPRRAEQAAGPGPAGHRAARRHPARNPGGSPVTAGRPAPAPRAGPCHAQQGQAPGTPRTAARAGPRARRRHPGGGRRCRRRPRRRGDRGDVRRELAAEGPRRRRGDGAAWRSPTTPGSGRRRARRRARDLLGPLGGRHGDDAANLQLLLAQLADVPDEYRGRRVRLRRGAGRARIGGRGRAGSGGVRPAEGTLLREPRGEGGFGYDPVLQPNGLDRSCAELSPGGEERHQPPRPRLPGAAARHRGGTGGEVGAGEPVCLNTGA